MAGGRKLVFCGAPLRCHDITAGTHIPMSNRYAGACTVKSLLYMRWWMFSTARLLAVYHLVDDNTQMYSELASQSSIQ